MSSSLLMKKLHLTGKKFVTSDGIKLYCNTLNLKYVDTIRYLIRQRYLVRIFKGIFYVKNLKEIKYGSVKYNHLELVANGLKLKGIEKWYFGLYTTLKLNNTTHEYFTTEYVISENFYRNKPITINNRKFKFHKLKTSLLNFGIVENKYKFSDLEKTFLDLIYLGVYSSKPKVKILMDIVDYSDNLSKTKIRKYATNYPNSVKKIIEEIN